MAWGLLLEQLFEHLDGTVNASQRVAEVIRTVLQRLELLLTRCVLLLQFCEALLNVVGLHGWPLNERKEWCAPDRFSPCVSYTTP